MGQGHPHADNERETVSIYILSSLKKWYDAQVESGVLSKGDISKITDAGLLSLKNQTSWKFSGNVLMGVLILGLAEIISLIAFLLYNVGEIWPALVVWTTSVVMIAIGLWVIMREFANRPNFIKIIEVNHEKTAN